MDIDVANSNFKLLLHLPKNSRLIVEKETNKLSVENRWFQGIRRSYNGDSRYDIIDPIKKTFDKLVEYGLTSDADFVKCLTNIIEAFKDIYSDFDKLKELVDRLMNDHFSSKDEDDDADDISSLEEAVIFDIPRCMKYGKRDFVIVVPEETSINFQEWSKIKKQPREIWGFAYLSPPKNHPDTETVVIDENSTWDKTTRKLGKVKHVDLTDKIPTMNDGKYEIRFINYTFTNISKMYGFEVKDGKIINEHRIY